MSQASLPIFRPFLPSVEAGKACLPWIGAALGTLYPTAGSKTKSTEEGRLLCALVTMAARPDHSSWGWSSCMTPGHPLSWTAARESGRFGSANESSRETPVQALCKDGWTWKGQRVLRASLQPPRAPSISTLFTHRTPILPPEKAR